MCPRGKAHDVFHLHIPKMAGRSLLCLTHKKVTGLNPCRFTIPFENHTWDSHADFDKAAKKAVEGGGEIPCFMSWESTWTHADMLRKLRQRTPVVLTVIRDPLLWVISAVHHQAATLQEASEQGCFSHDSSRCKLYYELRYPAIRELASSCDAMDHGAAMDHACVAQAKAHLAMSVFGILEHYRESECVMRWQFQGLTEELKSQCDCRADEHTKWQTEKVDNGALQRSGSGEEILIPDLIKMREAFGLAYEVYSFGVNLFHLRAQAMEAQTGIQLFC